MKKEIKFEMDIDLEEVADRSNSRYSAFSRLRSALKEERKEMEMRTTELFDRAITDLERELEDILEGED